MGQKYIINKHIKKWRGLDAKKWFNLRGKWGR